jgi:hypothetical protein
MVASWGDRASSASPADASVGLPDPEPELELELDPPELLEADAPLDVELVLAPELLEEPEPVPLDDPELPPSVPQSHAPKLAPSLAQTCAPRQAPGPRHACVAPGVQTPAGAPLPDVHALHALRAVAAVTTTKLDNR